MNLKIKPSNLSRLRVAFKRQSEARFLQIRATYFNRLKICIAVTVIALVALTITLFRLSDQHEAQAQENQKLLKQVAELQQQVNEAQEEVNLITSEKNNSNSKALTYIEGIQSKLKTINNYLSKRGLRSLPFKQPKSASKKAPTDEQVYKKYNSYLEQLVENVSLMPMGYPRVSSFTSMFGNRSNPFNFGGGEFHPGLDFRGNTGDPVKSTASGRVVFAGRSGGYGNCVKIRHTNNIETWYGHLSKITVKSGQRVDVGQLIGKVGSTGRSTGPHLHYEVRKNGRPVNPKSYLSLNM